MSLPWFLPLAKGWRYRLDQLAYGVGPPVIIPPQEAVELIAPEEPVAGWFLGANITFNHDQGTVYVEVDTWTASASPYELNFIGMMQPAPYGLWCSRYDPRDEVYNIAITTDGGLPYLIRYRIFVTNPLEDRDIRVLSYIMNSIRIEDPELFERSVSKFFGANMDPPLSAREMSGRL